MRRLLTAVVCAAIIGVGASGCGRQVTGIGTSQNLVPDGETLVRFETVGPLDTSDYSYIIVINNSLTNPGEPYGNITSFSKWSYVISFGGVGSSTYLFTSSTNQPTVTQIYTNPNNNSTGYLGYGISYGPDQLTLALNPPLSAGAGGGFDIRVNRCAVLDYPNPTPGSGTATGTCPPNYLYDGNVWYMNLFVVDRTGTIIDSMGTSGATDTSYSFNFDTTTNINGDIHQKTLTQQTSNTSGQIFGFQLFNAPNAGL